MQGLIIYLKNKIAFITAIGMAAFIGGITSAAVIASIPDSNGIIHSCYKNNTGALKVIDVPATSCANGETALSWSQSSGVNGTQAAYAKLNLDNTLDVSYSKNITSYKVIPSQGQDPSNPTAFDICFQISFGPKIAFVQNTGMYVGGNMPVRSTASGAQAIDQNTDCGSTIYNAVARNLDGTASVDKLSDYYFAFYN